jgi:hypothetical protein
MSDTKDDYISIDNHELTKCFQIQIKDNKVVPVYLGEYHEIPVPVNKVLKYNKNKLIVVTYILTEEEIDEKLFKLLGIVIVKEGTEKSGHSIDLIYSDDKLQIILVDHKNKKDYITLKVFDQFPKNEDMISELMELLTDERVVQIL